MKPYFSATKHSVIKKYLQTVIRSKCVKFHRICPSKSEETDLGKRMKKTDFFMKLRYFLKTKQGDCILLTLSSIYTHFSRLKKKALENLVEKGEIAQNEQYHLFPQCFLWNLYLKNLK